MFVAKRSFGLLLAAFLIVGVPCARPDDAVPSPGIVRKLGVDLDMRSLGRVMADEVRAAGNIILPDDAHPAPGPHEDADVQFHGGNVQVNDPKLTTSRSSRVCGRSCASLKAKRQSPPLSATSLPLTTHQRVYT